MATAFDAISLGQTLPSERPLELLDALSSTCVTLGQAAAKLGIAEGQAVADLDAVMLYTGARTVAHATRIAHGAGLLADVSLKPGTQPLSDLDKWWYEAITLGCNPAVLDECLSDGTDRSLAEQRVYASLGCTANHAAATRAGLQLGIVRPILPLPEAPTRSVRKKSGRDLTHAELTILANLAQGLGGAEPAAALQTSVSSHQNRLGYVFEKLAIGGHTGSNLTRSAAVYHAIMRGLLQIKAETRPEFEMPSPRELALAYTMPFGYSARTVGSLLGRSESTIKKLVLSKLLDEIGATNHTHAVARMFATGLWKVPGYVQRHRDSSGMVVAIQPLVKQKAGAPR